jgi:transposase
MGQASTIGLDIAKWVFQAHGADATGRVVFRKRLVRAKVLEFFAGQPPCLVALEACGGAHYWARELGKLGHTVRLIPPAYVKPFVKRQKNDVADAEAICEAAQRPGMRFVPVKDEAQQANAVVFRARDLLVRQRTEPLRVSRRPFCLSPTQRYGSSQAGHSRRPRPRREGYSRLARGGGGC